MLDFSTTVSALFLLLDAPPLLLSLCFVSRSSKVPFQCFSSCGPINRRYTTIIKRKEVPRRIEPRAFRGGCKRWDLGGSLDRVTIFVVYLFSLCFDLMLSSCHSCWLMLLGCRRIMIAAWSLCGAGYVLFVCFLSKVKKLVIVSSSAVILLNPAKKSIH